MPSAPDPPIQTPPPSGTTPPRPTPSGPPPSAAALPPFAAGLLASVALVVHSLHYVSTWTDDAYITFRYARNFAAGNGMVFNPGERLEGITNLGWALLLAPFSAFDLMTVARGLSLVLAVATVAMLARWSSRAGLSIVGTGVMLATLVLTPWVPLWTMQGLETVGVMFLLTLGWTRYAEEATASRGPLLSAVGMGLAPAVRPDAALLPVVLGAWHLWRRDGPKWTRRTAVSAGIVVSLGVALVALKLAWYGEILPNTFHLKVGSWPPTRGLAYLRNFFTVPSPFLPALVALAFVRAFAWAMRRDDRAIPGLVATAAFAATVLLNGDFMANFRFLVPAWPAACAALGLLVDDLVARVPLARRTETSIGALAVVAVALLPEVRAFAFDNLDRTYDPAERSRLSPVKEAPFWAPWREPMWGDGMVSQGPFPAAWTLVNAGPDTAVGYTDIGLISYLDDVPIVDLLGLTDRVLAGRDGQTGPDQWAYVNARVSYLLLDTKGPIWARYRDALAEGGWKPLDGCDTTWVFANPKLAISPNPPSPDELKRRLDLSLTRLSHHYGAQVAIVRELAAANAPKDVIRDYLDAIDRLHPSDGPEREQLRCDVGLGGPDCGAPRPACERGGPRVATSAMADASRWPAIVTPPGLPPPPPLLLRSRPEDAVGPPLDTPVEPETPTATAPPAAPVAPPRPAAPPSPCELAQDAAAAAWRDAFDAWSSLPTSNTDAARRLARVAASAAHLPPEDALAQARNAAEAAEATHLTTPPAEASAHAYALSQEAQVRCGK